MEIFLKNIRNVGRPTRKFNFVALVFSLLVNQFTNNWLQANISTFIINNQLNPDIAYLALIGICYYAAKSRRIL